MQAHKYKKKFCFTDLSKIYLSLHTYPKWNTKLVDYTLIYIVLVLYWLACRSLIKCEQ